jgi:hypothetical protein
MTHQAGEPGTNSGEEEDEEEGTRLSRRNKRRIMKVGSFPLASSFLWFLTTETFETPLCQVFCSLVLLI